MLVAEAVAVLVILLVAVAVTVAVSDAVGLIVIVTDGVSISPLAVVSVGVGITGSDTVIVNAADWPPLIADVAADVAAAVPTWVIVSGLGSATELSVGDCWTLPANN